MQLRQFNGDGERGVAQWERPALARSLYERLAARYPGDILAAGVYGSTARSEDTRWSDLELLFVVRDGSRARTQAFCYRGIRLHLRVVPKSELERDLANTPQAWEYWMTLLDHLQLLDASQEQVCSWLELGRAIPAEKCRETLEEILEWSVVESHGRVLSCGDRDGAEEVPWATMRLLLEIKLILVLLNRRWVLHHHFDAVVDTFAFPKVPEGYEALARALRSSRDPREAAALANRLVERLWELLDREGIRRPRDYRSVEELPL